jgi:hypothetical protein
MSLIRLTYRSRRNPELTDDALVQRLIVPAYHRNLEKGITGCLWCGEHSFVHVFEGEAAEVHGLMSRIAMDTRHSNLVVLSRTHARVRVFASWSLKWVRGESCALVDELASAAAKFAPSRKSGNAELAEEPFSTPSVQPASAPSAAAPLRQPPADSEAALHLPTERVALRVIAELVCAEATHF